MIDTRDLIGTHDFSAFTVADCETKTTIRTLKGVRGEIEEKLLTLFFTGDGFLRYQVRTMVAALVEANRRRLKADSIGELIMSRNRKLVGAPATAKGLTLMKVEY
jgi:tRNA pseudouridine38-40 synthase